VNETAVAERRITYRVEHRTRYVHAGTVSVSHHLGFLTPRRMPSQALSRCDLRIHPDPSDRDARVDYFGNELTYFAILTPYREITVEASAIVEIRPREQAILPERSPAWDAPADRRAIEDEQFCFASPYVPVTAALADLARAAFSRGRPLLAGAIDLMHLIHADFRYTPGSTTVTTPLARVLSDRRGVCQDFAHLQIGCLRSLGIPARYVSGYLCTDPPPGRPRLIGGDVSHAWLSVCCPIHGWVDLDPTNGVVPDVRHVTLAWGRDYGDVSPLRGVVLGGGEHELTVGVSVIPFPASVTS
jgi:transglutaminase-like putative cysteine protease